MKKNYIKKRKLYQQHGLPQKASAKNFTTSESVENEGEIKSVRLKTIGLYAKAREKTLKNELLKSTSFGTSSITWFGEAGTKVISFVLRLVTSTKK